MTEPDDDTRKNLEAAQQQLSQHKQYCDLCKADLHCATQVELEQYIRLAESWLAKVESK